MFIAPVDFTPSESISLVIIFPAESFAVILHCPNVFFELHFKVVACPIVTSAGSALRVIVGGNLAISFAADVVVGVGVITLQSMLLM